MYSLNKTILKNVSTNPYLGVLFSEDLTWSNHIEKITKKANSTLGFLRRNLRRCPTKCKKTAYLSLVRSTLEYGSIIWDPFLKKDIEAIERIQRSAARFITGDYRSRTPGSVQNLLEKLNLPSLQDRRKHLRLVFFYKLVEGLVPAMPYQNFLTSSKPGRLVKAKKNSDFISKNPVSNFVRNNDRTFNIPHYKSEQYKNSFFVKTCIEWNSLDNSVVNIKSVNSFRTTIEKQLNQQ